MAILWTDRDYVTRARRPARRWNMKTGELEPVLDDRGAPAFERVPQTGREGVVREVADIKATKPMALPRSVLMLRDDGNEAHMVVRNAAAAQHGDQGSDTSFMRYQFAKAKRLGWIAVGSCPLDLVRRRERNPLQMDSREIRAAAEKGESGCEPHQVGVNKPPCRHYVMERDARLARRLAEHTASVDRAKSDAAKTNELLVQIVQQKAESLAPQPVAADQEFAPVKKGPAK